MKYQVVNVAIETLTFIIMITSYRNHYCSRPSMKLSILAKIINIVDTSNSIHVHYSIYMPVLTEAQENMHSYYEAAVSYLYTI